MRNLFLTKSKANTTAHLQSQKGNLALSHNGTGGQPWKQPEWPHPSPVNTGAPRLWPTAPAGLKLLESQPFPDPGLFPASFTALSTLCEFLGVTTCRRRAATTGRTFKGPFLVLGPRNMGVPPLCELPMKGLLPSVSLHEQGGGLKHL